MKCCECGRLDNRHFPILHDKYICNKCTHKCTFNNHVGVCDLCMGDQ